MYAEESLFIFISNQYIPNIKVMVDFFLVPLEVIIITNNV